MQKRALFGLLYLLCSLSWGDVPSTLNPNPSPSVLVLYDGPENSANPARLDALFLTNLLGHFTTRRKAHSLDSYQVGEWKSYDAVFCIVFQKRYEVPKIFLNDIAQDFMNLSEIPSPLVGEGEGGGDVSTAATPIPTFPHRGGRSFRIGSKIFCWLGNQVGQLDRVGLLKKHGISFIKFSSALPFKQVSYKNRLLTKGDPETNLLKIISPQNAQVLATVLSSDHKSYPYVLRSGSFWIVADSPFSYSSENDRYLVLADVLHDILGIDHPQNHPAILRIEDINALSEPHELEATLAVIRKHHIPFSFGFVPIYINPHERLEYRLGDKPEVVSQLKKYVAAGGTPVLHGFTHQYRGVTTDDYEFWDDLGDRPVRGDNEMFASHRLEEAIKESMNLELYPVTWETPHYAASALDYRVFHRYFQTTFERRLVADHLDSDQYFPYPVVDLYGQYIIPENLAYVPLENPVVAPLLSNAEAAWVVRDGYASVFFHPFLKPALLEELISGIEQRGFHFIDIKDFPNEVRCEGRVIKTSNGQIQMAGHGRFLNEFVLGSEGKTIQQKTSEVPAEALLSRSVKLDPGQVYVAWRQETAPPNPIKKWLHLAMRLAKGDLSILQRKWESVFPGRVHRDPTRSAILWNSDAQGDDAKDQQSFYSSLMSAGYDIEQIESTRVSKEELGPFNLLVIPGPTAQLLSPQDTERLVNALKGGITLVTDGESPLSKALGITLGEPIPVSTVRDHLFGAQETRWPSHPTVPWITEPKTEDIAIYYSDRDQERPLVISGTQEEGRYLFLAPLFDPETGEGYARFPNLPYILMNELHVTPMLKRRGADVYFDPGYRQNISIEALAKMWRRFGIRAVHAAAWVTYSKYPYNYDYERLVRVAHQNGILVYAWFEWPMVSKRFWDQHPNWREKTALLTDAHVDWRYLMNLQDPQCLKAVLADTARFLSLYDWDGVNIGELTFESLTGLENPETFTPMNHVARKEFQEKHGFDPMELFSSTAPHFRKKDPSGLSAFFQYRRQVVSRLLKTFLGTLQQLNQQKKRHWEIIVTSIDTLLHPELADYLGIDLERIVALLNQYHATLQVEDPASEWANPPDRYTRLGHQYRRLPLSRPYMIDINVLPVHPSNQKGFATIKPTGVELCQLWRRASEQTPRVCFYSESSIFEQDWEVLPYAMAANASIRKEGEAWVIQTPQTVSVNVGRKSRAYHLDGEPWLCAEKGEVWIPPGEHKLTFSRLPRTWFDRTKLDTSLLSISGELLGSQRVNRGLEVEYTSVSRCALLFNKMPYKTFLDGQAIKLTPIRGDDGFAVIAPPGQHRLKAISESVWLYFVNFTSLVLASLIVVFGIASSGLLAVLFLFIYLHRRTRRIRRFIARRMFHLSSADS